MQNNNSNKETAIHHTPGEWAFNEEENTVSKYRLYSTETGKNIVWIDPDEESSEEEVPNINFIVKACNSHRALVDNLKRIIDRIEENDLQDQFPFAYKRAKEALKNAE